MLRLWRPPSSPRCRPRQSRRMAITVKSTPATSPTRSTRRPTRRRMRCWCSDATPTAHSLTLSGYRREAEASPPRRRSALRRVNGSGSVNLTPDGRLLFVVNAGDNTVSSFRVTASGLKLADREHLRWGSPHQPHQQRSPALRAQRAERQHLRPARLAERTSHPNCRLPPTALYSRALRRRRRDRVRPRRPRLGGHRARSRRDRHVPRPLRRLARTRAAPHRRRATAVRDRVCRLTPRGEQRGLCRDRRQPSSIPRSSGGQCCPSTSRAQAP